MTGVLLGSCSILCAQVNVTDILKRGFANTAANLRSMPANEQNDVLTVVAEMLSKKISFHADGYHASSIHHNPGGSVTRVEWKDFKVTRIIPEQITKADRANDLTKRYLVTLGCEASRTWEPKASNWSEWRNGGYILFPTAIRVEEMSGKLVASMKEYGQFLNGNGTILPTSKADEDLPPGMKRSGQ